MPKARQLTIVWLPARLLHEMAVTADGRKPLEAGGVLGGYWANKYAEAVVTHVIHAGPEAEHREDGMTPDSWFQDLELDRIFEETGGTSIYLGDWHSHPGLSAVPSSTDRRTLRRIALHPDAFAPQPLMLILDEADDSWGVTGWQGRFGTLGRLRPIQAAVVELRVG